ncbi:protein phosphatase 2C domain-containing protein [Streptomyces sp. TRM68367]|uniref:protein phosphatase 2C domain-containing protein n=1 Tax=Streptomyces sp. TRM68367 TaxID=2758415 RepID=UPI0037DDDA1B
MGGPVGQAEAPDGPVGQGEVGEGGAGEARDGGDRFPRAGLAPQRAPWEPPPATPSGPVTFPPGARREPVTDPAPRGRPASATDTPAAGKPTAPSVPVSRTPLDLPPPRSPAPPAPADTATDRDMTELTGRAAETDPAGRGSAPVVPSAPAADDEPTPSVPVPLRLASPPPDRDYVGSGPPTYEAEPTALPAADPEELDDLVADTVLDGARYGACTVRAASLRGDSARFRGELRRDSLLTARFGTGDQALVLVAMATGARATAGAHRAAAEACHWIGRAVGRSHARLVEDIRAARLGDLKSGLHRLTDRSLGKLRASAVEQGLQPEDYAATLRCLLLPADPECRTRVSFGVGAGGLFRLRGGTWQDIETDVVEVAGEPVVGFGSQPSETPDGDRLTMGLGIPTPPSPYEPAEQPREPFRFRAFVARPGDVLLICSAGLAEPLRGEPELSAHLTDRWSRPEPPGLAAFLADAGVRVKGYADDRTAAAVWEA